jgi:ADP-ribose pyrophosphatase YjhB (NUDIX family)
MPTQGAATVIVNEQDEVLLVLREDARVWALPAGHLEPGETYEQAAVRETREETGYQIVLERLVGRYWRPQYPGGGNTQVVYLGRAVGGDPSQHDWESLEVRWFPLDALPWRLYPFSRAQICDALADNSEPFEVEQRLPRTQFLLLQAFLAYRRVRNALRALTRTTKNHEGEDL